VTALNLGVTGFEDGQGVEVLGLTNEEVETVCAAVRNFFAETSG
jgi:hypothetical protein